MKQHYQESKKKPTLPFVLFGIACIIVLAYWFISDRKIDRFNLNTQFAGKVERVEYDIKQFPTITMNDSTYYIGFDTDHQIEIGDSIIKKKGSEVYVLKKYKTQKIIEFTK